MMAWEEASLLGAWFTHFTLTPKFCFSAGLLVLVGLHIDHLIMCYVFLLVYCSLTCALPMGCL